MLHVQYFNDLTLTTTHCHSLWPPCVADVDIIFLPCGFFFFKKKERRNHRMKIYMACPIT